MFGRRKQVNRTISAQPEVGHLLEVTDLHTSFKTPRGLARAVNGVSFVLERGKTLGIVGESGSGKSVLSRSIMGLLPKNNVVREGSVRYKGEEIANLSNTAMRQYWGTEMAMVFQDPMTSLNPVVKVGRQITESLKYHLDMERSTRTSCRAACGSASSSRSPSPAAPACCSPTSRPPRST